MKICIAGKNEIAVNALLSLLNNGIDRTNICACINKTDTGKHSWQPSFKAICEREGISIVSLNDLYPIEDLFFLSLEFDQIIDVKKFRSSKLFNIHFSYLPSYKGMYTSVLPILHGRNLSGVTLHIIDQGIDTGEIVDQIRIKIPQNFNSSDLYNSYLKNGLKLFESNIDDILNEDYDTQPQPKCNSSYYSKNTLDFSSLIIDFNKTAYEIKNQIRAFAFRSYQLPSYQGVEISHVLIDNKKSYLKPGTELSENSDSFLISSIDYNIRLFKDKLDEILSSAKKGDLKTLQRLKEKKYKLYEKNNKGWNSLIVAAYNEQQEICNWLIDNGVSPNSVNNNGTSTLMYAMTTASKSGNLNLLELLLDKGANINHKDLYGKNVLHYSKKYDDMHIHNFLKKRF